VNAETAGLLALIFAGAFFDAAPVTSFFVFGEAFFILAGGAAVTSGSPLPILAAYAGAWSADQTGFALGRWMRPFTRRILLRRMERRRIVRKTERLLRRGGVFAIAATRFMGPVAWVAPLISGTLSLRYRTFALGSALGVIFGVGQFLVIGALGALALTQGGGPGVTALLEKHGLALALAGQGVFLLAIGVWLLVRRRKKTVPLRPE
jgi:membrane protein DedA with SNARE-associated domain